MKGDVYNVVSVTNNTTRTSFDIARPGGRIKERPAIVATAAGIILFFTAATLTASPLTALLIAAASAVTSYFVVEGATTMRVKKGSPAATLAARHAGYLEKKQELLDFRDGQRESSRHNAGLRTRLVSLIEKMRSVDGDLYGSRITQAEAAIDILDKLISLDEASLEQYAKTITMIEIERESFAVTESMTAEAAGMIADRMATLEEVVEQNADLKRLLEANEEVQRLLN